MTKGKKKQKPNKQQFRDKEQTSRTEDDKNFVSHFHGNKSAAEWFAKTYRPRG